MAGGLGRSPGRQSGASRPLQPPLLCGRSHLALLSPHPDAFAFRKELMTLGLVPESQLEPWALVWHPLQARAEPAHLPGHCCLLCLLLCVCGDPTEEEQGGERRAAVAGPAVTNRFSPESELSEKTFVSPVDIK